MLKGETIVADLLFAIETRKKEIYDFAFQSNQMEANEDGRISLSVPFAHPIQIGKLDTIGAGRKKNIFMTRVKCGSCVGV